eukprot:6472122-Amphidinium_carterae.1
MQMYRTTEAVMRTLKTTSACVLHVRLAQRFWCPECKCLSNIFAQNQKPDEFMPASWERLGAKCTCAAGADIQAGSFAYVGEYPSTGTLQTDLTRWHPHNAWRLQDEQPLAEVHGALHSDPRLESVHTQNTSRALSFGRVTCSLEAPLEGSDSAASTRVRQHASWCESWNATKSAVWVARSGYSECVNAIIRPPRASYSVEDLGPASFRLRGGTASAVPSEERRRVADMPGALK